MFFNIKLEVEPNKSVGKKSADEISSVDVQKSPKNQDHTGNDDSKQDGQPKSLKQEKQQLRVMLPASSYSSSDEENHEKETSVVAANPSNSKQMLSPSKTTDQVQDDDDDDDFDDDEQNFYENQYHKNSKNINDDDDDEDDFNNRNSMNNDDNDSENFYDAIDSNQSQTMTPRYNLIKKLYEFVVYTRGGMTRFFCNFT